VQIARESGACRMPEISRFRGIVIRMYNKDHNPPHFHAQYGDDTALIKIEDLTILRGSLPGPQWSLVIEWAGEHQGELMENWRLAQAGESLNPIEPLS
jgi:hypothetical protein